MRKRLNFIMQFNNKRNLFLILFLVFLVVLVLSLPAFAPNYYGINPDDETKYIESGRLLLQGQLREISWGPFLAILYAALYLITKSSPYWFFWSLTLGRVVLFGLLWLSIFRLAFRLSDLIHPGIIFGLMLLSVASTEILQNPSDALFATLYAFALENMIAFGQTKKTKYIRYTSLLLGLAALTRNDGIPAFMIFLIVALISGLRWKVKTTTLIASILLPYFLVLGSYFMIGGIVTGKYSLGTTQRLYQAFEQGQTIVTGSSFNNATQETRQLFGTPEENKTNVLLAISRNPSAFVIRIKADLRAIPRLLQIGYGHNVATLLILSLIGFIGMIRRKHYYFACLLLSWPAFLFSYFLGFFQPVYLLQAYSVVIVTAAFGIDYLFCKQRNLKGKLFWISGISLCIITFAIARFTYGVVGVTLIAVGFLIEWLLEQYAGKSINPAAFSLMALLGLGLMIKEPYPFPTFNNISQSPQVQAIVFLEKTLPLNTNVLTGTQLPAVAAGMTSIDPYDIPGTITSQNELFSWLHQNNVKAIFVDGALESHSDLWNLIDNSIGTYLQASFESTTGSVQVLLVNNVPSTPQ